MAKRARQEVFAAHLERLPLRVLRAQGYEVRPHHVAAEPGDREAALLLALFAFRVDDFRIGKNNFRFGILSGGHVHDGDTHAQSDLRRGQPDSLRRVHGSKHVFGELLELGVEFCDRRGRLLQDRIGILHDLVDLSRRLGSGWRFRSCRVVGHSSRNSAASRQANLPRIFAEKRAPAQVPPWLRRRLRPQGRRTSRNARKRP